jgi:hypothetical protein
VKDLELGVQLGSVTITHRIASFRYRTYLKSSVTRKAMIFDMQVTWRQIVKISITVEAVIGPTMFNFVGSSR